jgi:hypothetical protein
MQSPQVLAQLQTIAFQRPMTSTVGTGNTAQELVMGKVATVVMRPGAGPDGQGEVVIKLQDGWWKGRSSASKMWCWHMQPVRIDPPAMCSAPLTASLLHPCMQAPRSWSTLLGWRWMARGLCHSPSLGPITGSSAIMAIQIGVGRPMRTGIAGTSTSFLLVNSASHREPLSCLPVSSRQPGACPVWVLPLC